jgi:hypothetical protein
MAANENILERFQQHINRRISRVRSNEACNVTVIFLDNEAPLSEAEQSGAQKENTPIFIKRPSGWSIYGNVGGEWGERVLDNLTAAEKLALSREPFNSEQSNKISINAISFPPQLKPRLSQCHTYSNKISGHDMEAFLDRVLNDLETKGQDDELRLMNQMIESRVTSLIAKIKDIALDTGLSLEDRCGLMYDLYKGYQNELRQPIEALLYPNEGPSIEQLEIDVQGEPYKTLGDYIRGKVGQDAANFNDSFIRERLVASYLKMCMFYVNAQITPALQQQSSLELQLLQRALFEAGNPIDKDTFLEHMHHHKSKLEEQFKATEESPSRQLKQPMKQSTNQMEPQKESKGKEEDKSKKSGFGFLSFFSKKPTFSTAKKPASEPVQHRSDITKIQSASSSSSSVPMQPAVISQHSASILSSNSELSFMPVPVISSPKPLGQHRSPAISLPANPSGASPSHPYVSGGDVNVKSEDKDSVDTGSTVSENEYLSNMKPKGM